MAENNIKWNVPKYTRKEQRWIRTRLKRHAESVQSKIGDSIQCKYCGINIVKRSADHSLCNNGVCEIMFEETKPVIFNLTRKQPVTSVTISRNGEEATFYVAPFTESEFLSKPPFEEFFEEKVIEWEGIMDEKGESLPCSPRNRRMLAFHCTDIAIEVLDSYIKSHKEKQ